MDKDKILDYVRKTPANTNPNVLKTMLDDSGSEMNPGYSCTETVTLLTDESVTTVFDEVNNSGKLAYSTSIDADTIRVTFDGTEYTCNAQEGEMGTLYGAPMGEEGLDWSEYPFQISSGLRNDIYTKTAGTYQVKIETVEEVVETSECFKKAVASSLETKEIVFQNNLLTRYTLTNKSAVTIPANSSATITLEPSDSNLRINSLGLQSIKTNHNELVVCGFHDNKITLYNTSNSAITLAIGECVGEYINFIIGAEVTHISYSPESSDGSDVGIIVN